MNSEELKKIQAPIKEKYLSEPETAKIKLSAIGQLGNGISCKVDTGKALIEAGLHKATGGSGMLACSGDMLLEALVACAGVTLQAVATSIGVPINGGTLIAEGELDFRGTLGVAKDIPVGFSSIILNFNLETEASAEQLQTLLKLTERYCVVFQTLSKGVNIVSKFPTNI